MRVVVCQADGRRHKGAVRQPLSVGLVRWRGQGVHTAAIAKMTLRWKGGECVLSAPTVVGPAMESELAPGELSHPSDFVFPKPRCDVLVVGHAYAPSPSVNIAGAFSVGGLLRVFTARAAVAEAMIPLTTAHLDRGTRLGPRRIERESSRDVLSAFDRERLQSAEEASRLDALAADAAIELTALSVRERQLGFALPGLVPRLFLERGIGDYVEIALVCDTLLVDTDYEQLDLTFRGLVPEALGRADRMIAVVDDVRAPRPIDEHLRYLPRGTVSFAIEEDATDPGDVDELEMARYEVMQHAAPPELSLDEFARISAELGEQREPRADVLDRYDLDERRWTIEERAWSDVLARDTGHGDGRLAVELGERTAVHQAALAGPDEPRPVEYYAAARARILGGEPPNEVLAGAGISPGEWMRLERHWLERAERDPAIASVLRRS